MEFDRLEGARAVLFDKDGTLFDFQRSWGAFGARIVRALATEALSEPGGAARPGPDVAALAADLAEAAGFDLATERYRPHAPIVSGAVAEVAEAWSAMLPGWSAARIERWLNAQGAAAEAELAPAASDLPALLTRLRTGGLSLGVATHDAAASAEAHLARAGVLDQFVFIAGYDSGFPRKPDPAVFFAFCDQAGCAPSEVVMVGDSHHDLRLGRRGGALASVGVLTGPARALDLEADADIVLASIEGLPALLGV